MGEKIADQLRREIRRTGLSGLQLSKLAGVTQQRLSSFMNGSDMRLTNAGRLAEFLELELRPKRRKRASGRRPKAH